MPIMLPPPIYDEGTAVQASGKLIYDLYYQ